MANLNYIKSLLFLNLTSPRSPLGAANPAQGQCQDPASPTLAAPGRSSLRDQAPTPALAATAGPTSHRDRTNLATLL